MNGGGEIVNNVSEVVARPISHMVGFLWLMGGPIFGDDRGCITSTPKSVSFLKK